MRYEVSVFECVAERLSKHNTNSSDSDYANGENDDHRVEYSEGTLSCTCAFFAGHGFCTHTMAIERMLEDMLSPIEVPQR